MQINVIGVGRVGAPLAAWLAAKPEVEHVAVSEINPDTAHMFETASFDWQEPNLNQAIKNGFNLDKLSMSNDISSDKFDFAFICVGTPVEDGLPITEPIIKICQQLNKSVTPILRSTSPPHFTKELSQILKRPVIYAPERLLLGNGFSELNTLPQIIGTTFQLQPSENINQLHVIKAIEIVNFLKIIFPTYILGTSTEAELAKLYNNTVRYVEFALGTELSEGAGKVGADWRNVREMMSSGYPRSAMAFPSFVASYCLTKDWQMLTHAMIPSSIAKSAHEYNTTLFKRLIEENKIKLKNKNIAVFGLTYKPDLDDVRDSITFELLDWLNEKMPKRILLNDPIVNCLDHINNYNYPIDVLDEPNEIIDNADVIFIMTAHSAYLDINFPKGKIIIDPACHIKSDSENIKFVRRT